MKCKWLPVANLCARIFFLVIILIAGNVLNCAGSGHLTGEARVKPWSGWWWPKSAGELVFGYNGKPSPVVKYDLCLQHAYPGPAYFQALHQWYDGDAKGWEGFCNGWVNASILEAEPDRATILNGVYLAVGDKKGLLTACHASDVTIYENCGANPAIFHKYLIENLLEKKRCIGADLDSSEEFWSYPIFRFEMDIISGKDADQVDCTIYHADDFVDPDYVGTAERTRNYRYQLEKNDDGAYTGTGRWLKSSSGSLHPEWVWVPVGINQNKLFVEYDKVVEMADSRDQGPIGEGLKPGHHLLVLEPGEKKINSIYVYDGNQYEVKLALDPQINYGDQAWYSLKQNGREIKRGTLDAELETILIPGAETGADIELELGSRLDNHGPVCIHLLMDVQGPYMEWLYGLGARSGDWIGTGVIGARDAARGWGWLELVDGDGNPVGVGDVAPATGNQGESWFSVVNNAAIPIDYRYETGKAVAVKLVTNTPVTRVILCGNNVRCQLRGNSGYSTEVGKNKFVIPWLSTQFDLSKKDTFYLHNLAADYANVKISYMGDDGTPGLNRVIKLEKGVIAEYPRGSYPGPGSFSGWALVESDSPIKGAVIREEGRNSTDMLPLLSTGNAWMMPYLVVGQGWSSILGLCNCNAEKLTVLVNAIIDGSPTGSSWKIDIEPYQHLELPVSGARFGLTDEEIGRAWLSLEGNMEYAGYAVYRFGVNTRASVPLFDFRKMAKSRNLTPLAVNDGWWTGLVLINDSESPSKNVALSVLARNGKVLRTEELVFPPGSRQIVNIGEMCAGIDLAEVAGLRLENATTVKALTFYGGLNGTEMLGAKAW